MGLNNHHPKSIDKKLLRCPGCEKEFSGRDTVLIKDGLMFCPNCEVELKTITDGYRPTVRIVDEFVTIK